jgi:hypothetical protein
MTHIKNKGMSDTKSDDMKLEGCRPDMTRMLEDVRGLTEAPIFGREIVW